MGREYILSGFLWNPLGMVAIGNPLWLRSTSLWGMTGLSGWILALGLMGHRVINTFRLRDVTSWLGLYFAPCCAALISYPLPKTAHVHVALVQPALLPDQKDFHLSTSSRWVHPLVQWDRIWTLLENVSQPIDLILFPEAAFPLGLKMPIYEPKELDAYWRYKGWGEQAPVSGGASKIDKVGNGYLAQAMADQLKASVVVGLDDLEGTQRYNGAFLFQSQETDIRRYTKQILMPVVEYIPWSWVPGWTDLLKRLYGIQGSFHRGVSTKPWPDRRATWGVCICAEETCSELVRKQTQQADALLSLSNDGWFPSSKLPWVHAQHAKVRAVENGIFVLRACSTGLTVIFDPWGQEIGQLPVSETSPSILTKEIDLHRNWTLYHTWGDLPLLVISFGCWGWLSLREVTIFRRRFDSRAEKTRTNF
jgi:apolipoprotein N-acyltransferase